jgi:hypothetical protein
MPLSTRVPLESALSDFASPGRLSLEHVSPDFASPHFASSRFASSDAASAGAASPLIGSAGDVSLEGAWPRAARVSIVPSPVEHTRGVHAFRCTAVIG